MANLVKELNEDLKRDMDKRTEKYLKEFAKLAETIKSEKD